MSDESYSLEPLFNLVARLRGPEGCPWDREQEITDIRAYLVEEAHEVAAAIDSGDWDEIKSELGDLLFQLVFTLELARETSTFGLADVVESIHRKMVDRHPHVFGDQRLDDSRAVRAAWERRKLEGEGTGRTLLGGLPPALPALLATYRMTQKAASVGLDWTEPAAVLDKVEEEIDELRTELSTPFDGRDEDRVRAELGDLMFTLANLSRHLGHDPEAVLAEANRKFRRRVEQMETELGAKGLALTDLDADGLDELWDRVKSRTED